MTQHTSISGSLVGTALGDSLGLPSEGMSRQRILKRWKGRLNQRLFFGRGMLSDDTEHTIFSAYALLESNGDAAQFQRILAARLRWWLLSLPAGVGLATARSIIKLWLGFGPQKSGVFSAGNGPAMRAPILGVYFKDDPAKRRQFVTASALLTHTDPKATEGAILAAECAAFAANGEGNREIILSHLESIALSPEWRDPLHKIRESLDQNLSTQQFAASIGLGNRVSGYIAHTMPVVIFVWLRHRGDFAAILKECIACGGDTDTVAAIAGGIAGAETEEFDHNWTTRITDFPFSLSHIQNVAEALDQLRRGETTFLKRPSPLWSFPRNLFFLLIILTHGMRRIFPPY